MAKNFTVQSSFNNGVLDPLLAVRYDIKQYFQGVETGTNVDFLPHGGARRRPGLEYIDTITEYAVEETIGQGDPSSGPHRIIPFIFNTDQKYLLVFGTEGIGIYRDDVLVAEVATAYDDNDLFDLDYAQTADTMILVHEDHAPATLVRGATDASWTLNDITFDYTPQFDFDDSDSPTPTSEIQTLSFTNFLEGDTFKLNLEGIDTEEISYSGDEAATAANIQTAMLDLINLPGTGVTVAASAPASPQVFTVTFADGAADDWDLLTGRVITTVNNDTNNTIAAAETQAGTARTEDVWGGTRGYPRTVTFHEARLWFGGSAQLPNTLWASRVNGFFNFDPGKARADQAIDITLNTDQINRIQAITSNRALQIFTIGGEFVVKQSTTDPITPENVAIIPQTRLGSKKIKPVNIEGATIFVQRTGKAVQEFVFDFGQDAFSSGTLSLLATSLIENPTQTDVLRGTEDEDANRVYFVNTDGTVAVFNTLRSQDIAAWSKWTTDGTFKSVAVLLDEVYFVVNRTIGGVSRWFIEKANTSLFTDSAAEYTALGSATLTGLTHLEGETVRIKGDGAVLADAVVASGSATAERSITAGEAGLGFTVTVKTLPVVQDPGNGFNLDDEKRITRCTLDVFESLGLYVNGIQLPDRVYGAGLLDTTPTPYTGRKNMPLLGWSKTAQVTITQPDPLPMTIRGIGLEIDG